MVARGSQPDVRQVHQMSEVYAFSQPLIVTKDADEVVVSTPWTDYFERQLFSRVASGSRY